MIMMMFGRMVFCDRKLDKGTITITQHNRVIPEIEIGRISGNFTMVQFNKIGNKANGFCEIYPDPESNLKPVPLNQ